MNASSSLTRRLSVGAVVPLLTVAALGCGGSSKPSSTNATSNQSTKTAAQAAATTRSDLSGKWSGQYSGSFSGAFTLNWQASGSTLSGTIVISQMGDQPIPINGTLNGDTISFGTVGSQAITYTGSVSNGAMSGDWKLEANGNAAGSGSWHASHS
jgi:hypothetical protein